MPAHPGRFAVPSQPGQCERRCLGEELADPAHPLGGRLGMVAELLRHGAIAATAAELAYR
jgi:hypothetical protein